MQKRFIRPGMMTRYCDGTGACGCCRVSRILRRKKWLPLKRRTVRRRKRKAKSDAGYRVSSAIPQLLQNGQYDRGRIFLRAIDAGGGFHEFRFGGVWNSQKLLRVAID